MNNLIVLGIFNLIFFIISAIAKSECDTIKDKKFNMIWFKTKYWESQKDTTKRSWLFKYPLSFMWDGWHLMDSTRNYCLSMIVLIPFILAYSSSWYFILGFSIILYVIYGLIFELFYQN